MSALTDDQRARLVAVMARAMCNDFRINWDNPFHDGLSRWLENARVALAAAEAAGWRLVPPDDGR